MSWLRLVGSLKSQVSFAEYSLFYRALLQERPRILCVCHVCDVVWMISQYVIFIFPVHMCDVTHSIMCDVTRLCVTV